MTIEDFIEELKVSRESVAKPVSLVIWTTASKEYFSGSVVAIDEHRIRLKRKGDGNDVIIVRVHIVAYSAMT